MSHNDCELWRRSVAQLRQEVAQLAPGERRWLEERLAVIAGLQEKMHALFLAAGSEVVCRDCRGDCCDRGKYHLTLVNLLPFLLDGEEPPPADFSRPCPFLGVEGCSFPVGRRPFNCLTFLCEQVEAQLRRGERHLFYDLERQLREAYLAFDRRYAGSSLRGLLNRAERLAGRRFLDRP